MSLTITDYAQGQAALRQKVLRQALYDEGAVIMNQVLVNLHGQAHRERRQLESHVFRRDFFRYYETEVFPTTLSETINPFLGEGLGKGRMDVVDFGYHVMVNLTADFTGIDRPEKSLQETQELIDMLRLFSRTAIIAHSTEDRDRLRDQAIAGLETFDRRYVTPSLERRRALVERFRAGDIAEDKLPRDILCQLVRNEDGIELPDDVVLRETAFFGLAGAHTSIHSLGHAVHEVFTWCEAHPEDRARLLEDLMFLQRCVHESFRLHPSSPVAARRALGAVTLAGMELAEGDRLDISLQECNRDVSVFGEDAAEFNPHRSLPKGITPYGLSFGTGMHACLGLNLAAGVLPRDSGSTDSHQFGTVALIVHKLLSEGAVPDPERAPKKDASTTRDLWGEYPVLLPGAR